MNKHYYTDERNAQIVIALLKAHGIKDIVISPGATNDCFVLSVQDDPDFNLYSAVDERHAGYLACGISEEKKQPVVLNCTGATASRNYMSAMTEAYYRKLPILALTCSQHYSHLGNLHPQMTDRFNPPSDVAKLSVQCPIPHTKEEEWDCNLKVNRALLELSHRGGGPVHINLETSYSRRYSLGVMPSARTIRRVVATDNSWPMITDGAKIVIWMGSHTPLSTDEATAIESFLKAHNAVVLGDMTSNYKGMQFVAPSLLGCQKHFWANQMHAELRPDLIVHIGEVCGDYSLMSLLRCGAPVWRVNPDGELRDPLRALTYVFEMPENEFFKHYTKGGVGRASYASSWGDALCRLQVQKPEIPFSELYVSEVLARAIPEQVELHLGILNPLRCANLALPNCERVFCNVGGFGIDGTVSELIGAASVRPNTLYLGVVGDLSFFYDLNSLGSRHLGKNVRLLIFNNGEGGEFLVPGNIVECDACGERVHDYISARGHYGKKSRTLIKRFSESLGMRYFVATNKDELAIELPKFLGHEGESAAVLECFTDSRDDRNALAAYSSIEACSVSVRLKTAIGSMLPADVRNVVKHIIKK